VGSAGYELEVTFFCAEVDEAFPVVYHVFAADGALGFSQELGGPNVGKRRDFILWKELTESEVGRVDIIPQIVTLNLHLGHQFLDLCVRRLFSCLLDVFCKKVRPFIQY
jgi:hypothetical protein